MPRHSQFSAGLDSTFLASNQSVSQHLTTPSYTFLAWEADLILVPSALAPTDFKMTAQPSENKAHF